MKKIVFSIVILVTMTSVNTYASQIFDNPPQKQWGQTRVDESCRDAGVSYDRLNSSKRVNVYTDDKTDVNMIIERKKDNSSSSYDTRSNWKKDNNGYTQNINEDDNVDIKCYPRGQK